MDVQKKLDEIVTTVTGARSMPMSASCVVNRAELLALLEELRAGLPGSLARAQELIGDREQLVAEAREEAERIIESARAHRGSLISDTEVARQSQEEADRILAEARRQAEEVRAEADDYVDSKLANFEVVLTKTIGSVDRGREKLLGRADGNGGHGEPDGDADAPEPSSDPRVQRQQADAYVDAKLGAVSAVLSKTLEAVGRGREKLLGARPADELGAHMAAQDGFHAARPTSDADFLAGLAAPHAQTSPEPAAAPHAAPHAGYDGYYEPQGYGADPYVYQQQYEADGSQGQQADPYAVQGGYHQADPYAWSSPAPGDGYGGAQSGYVPQQHQPAQHQPAQHQPAQHQSAQHQPAQDRPQAAGGALDETSLFDTSMIDLEQLRRYEQGR
ncbi:ATP synthase F0 subunit B [Streptomyces aureoversilis]|uniref:ATP synthase F0 subunit B n=1 Tax=Streptomyces aureoversilis TaxID=67277 RepID=A0ABW0A706_9ACTN